MPISLTGGHWSSEVCLIAGRPEPKPEPDPDPDPDPKMLLPAGIPEPEAEPASAR